MVLLAATLGVVKGVWKGTALVSVWGTGLWCFNHG